MLKRRHVFSSICNVSYLNTNAVSSENRLWYFRAFVSQREKIKISETCIYIRVPLKWFQCNFTVCERILIQYIESYI